MDKRIEERTVREVMTRTPKTVRPETDVRTLQRMFQSYDFNAFPVVDEEQAARRRWRRLRRSSSSPPPPPQASPGPISIDDVVIVENEWARTEDITPTDVTVRIRDLRPIRAAAARPG